ncbi:glycosyltransferase [Microbulbifer sp. Q7]|uniref:glycosyltransferase n=1 Tax=Microbulbifer sp. Q7 TaxID=1785091 RepID=UPI00082DA879|nr:glycosyltransferase [Microbulbifer sp. Q7]
MLTAQRPQIAYLAPEIPGRSSTFVYNEILELEKLGINVVPFSLHSVKNISKSEQVARISSICTYLYETGVFELLAAQILCFWRRPSGYLTVLGVLTSDVLKLVKQPRRALGMIYRFLMAAKFANKLAAQKIADIHCHFCHIAADVAMYASAMNGGNFSITAHANDLFEHGYLLREKSERASFIATISEYNVKLLQKSGIQPDKIRLVRCGVDDKAFEPRPFRPLATVLRIGCLARLVEKKGIDLLISAASILKKNGIPFELVIAGSGPLETALKEMAKSSGIWPNTKFLGEISHDQVASWYGSIDVFVLPAKKDSNGDMDGIPVVLMEAMMRRVPVISTNISGIPELVRDKKTGLIARPEAHSIAATIIAFIKDTERTIVNRLDEAEALVRSEFKLSDNALRLAKFKSLIFIPCETAKVNTPCQISLHS